MLMLDASRCGSLQDLSVLFLYIGDSIGIVLYAYHKLSGAGLELGCFMSARTRV
jgi:hypothetical protein